MTKVLYDALYPAGIPLDIPTDALVASYVDHPEVVPPCMTQLAQRFPNNVNVSISAHGHLAQIYDVESGAIDPAAVPHLIRVNYALHMPAVVYCAPRTRPAIEAALVAASVPDPWWWCVDRAGAPFIPDGWDGNQWLGAGPYDQSLISDQLALILTAGGDVPSGIGTLIGDDVLNEYDPVVQRLLKWADLGNFLESTGLVSGLFNTGPDTRTRIGLIQYQLGLLVAAQPTTGTPDLTPLTDLIKDLPAETVAAIKAAL